MKQILETIAEVSQGHWFLYAFPAAFVLLLVLMKGKRRQIVPLGILALAVCNPLFVKLWNRLDLYAYWRMLWVVPVIPVFAAIPAAVSGKLEKAKPVCRTLAVLACVAVFALMGTFLYTGPGGKFVLPAENREKLPDAVKLIADYLLSLNDHPRVIADYNISVYLRQYNGQIETLYGRDVEGYILSADSEVRSVDRQVRDPVGDLSKAAEIMLNDGYDYLVIRDYDRGDQLEKLQLDMLAHYAGYGIYVCRGTPTVLKERNSLGQVVRKTYLSADGSPALQDGGYVSVEYAYDGNGYLCREFRVDAEGKGAADASGRAGCEYVLDRKGRVISEKSLGADGQAVMTDSGYAEIRREYAAGLLTGRESYFDAAGNPVVSGAGYAQVLRKYQGKTCVSEAFFDEKGSPMAGSAGYARMERTLDGSGHVLLEQYYDAGGHLTLSESGYAQAKYTWDAGGRLTGKQYLDADGRMCLISSGFAGIAERDSEQGRVRTYADSENRPVVRPDGYAAVRWRKENGKTCLEFLDADMQPLPLEGRNLTEDAYPVWSEWMRPSYGKENVNIHIGSVNLGGQKAGDAYTCQVEIEFLGAAGAEGKAFSFRPQGAQDGKWVTGNVWNGGLILLDAPPADGIYRLSSTQYVTESMEGISTFDLDFRCDNWSSGMFRVRRVKIEKGSTATAWTDGP